MQNVLITGISGSVGHYLFDVLVRDSQYHLYLVLRKPENLKRDVTQYKNITLLKIDIRDVHKQKELLRQMDYVIWIATCWGGYERPWHVNVYPLFRSLRRLDAQRLKKVVYFSTASILNKEHQPVEEVREIGTNYIRSKFLAHKMLQYNKLKDKIITVFPTWVYGGDSTHPFSHAASGLRGIKKWTRLLKYFTLDFRFHFIHCADIAAMIKYMLENEMDKNEYVLGNAPLTVGDFTHEIAAYYGQKTLFQIPLPPRLLLFLARLAKKHPWDIYCLGYRQFVYDVLNCRKLGLPSETDTIAGVLTSMKK